MIMKQAMEVFTSFSNTLFKACNRREEVFSAAFALHELKTSAASFRQPGCFFMTEIKSS